MPTADQTLAAFCSQVSAGTPAPGGGAVAAVAGAMGASLVAMVAGLTVGREKYAAVNDEMADIRQTGMRESDALFACADADAAAFEKVMAAFALPKANDTDKAARQAAVQAGYQEATCSPLKTMEHCLVVMRSALTAATRGNQNALSDAYVGYLMASAAFEGGLWNVAINLGSLKEEGFKQEVLDEVSRLRSERTAIAEAFHALVPDPVGKFTSKG